MSAKPSTSPDRPNLVDLIDFIDDESGTVIELADLVHAVGDVMAGLEDDENVQTLFNGLGVVGGIISDKVEEIKSKADELYKAYVGLDGDDKTAGAR